MTAHFVYQIGCDRCGTVARGPSNVVTEQVRAMLQRAGWRTERHGDHLKDYCAPCAEALRLERTHAQRQAS